MDTNRANLNALFQTFSTAFNAGLTATPIQVNNAVKLLTFAMTAMVGGAAVVHAWLESIPELTEWLGTKAVKNLKSNLLTVAHKDYANAVTVRKKDIADDTYGVYTPLIQVMGNQGAQLWEKLAIEALRANGNWADGAPFFGTARVYGANAIVNKTTSALDADTFAAGILAMRSYMDADNQPLNVVPRVLLVGPKLEKIAFDLVKNSLVTAGTGKGGAVQNWAQGLCDLQVSNRLVGTYDDYWFILGEQAGLLPVFVQQRELPKIVAQDDDGTDAAFLRGEYRYGVEARGAAFLTMPHLAYAGIL